jgi:hypothetical protein
MSDLDDKLKDLLFSNNPLVPEKNKDDTVKAIHKMFADAHYFKLEGKKYLNNGEILPLYSGQEWYDAFLKEFHALGYISPEKQLNLYAYQIVDLAKKASGLVEL